MKKVITSVHDFVGNNLMNALKKEYTIYGLDINNMISVLEISK